MGQDKGPQSKGPLRQNSAYSVTVSAIRPNVRRFGQESQNDG